MKSLDKNFPKLYSLISVLSAYISDESELGSIVGYSIINSLKNFNTRRKNPRSLKLKETQRVYKGLEEIMSNKELKENHYSILKNIQKEVNSYLEKVINHEDLPKNSPLLKEIIKFISLKEKNKEDLIKVAGQELVEFLKRNNNKDDNFQRNLIKDYEIISHYFTRKKGDRR